MNPFLYGTPKFSQATAAASTTSLTASGALYSLVTGTTNGTTIVGVYIKGTQDTVAGMARIFVYDGSALTELYDEVSIDAITVSATTAAYARLWVPPQSMVLSSGAVLKFGATTTNLNVFTARGDY